MSHRITASQMRHSEFTAHKDDLATIQRGDITVARYFVVDGGFEYNAQKWSNVAAVNTFGVVTSNAKNVDGLTMSIFVNKKR